MIEKIINDLSLVIDEPESVDVQFNFEAQAKDIAKFLTKDNMPTPFVIAIHGEWGSGKTTLLRNIKRKIESCSSLKIIEFDAWEYERIDIFASLLQCIKNEFHSKNKQFGNAIVTFGTDALLRKIFSMSKEEAEIHFKNMIKKTKTIKKQLENVIKKKLVIIIDDLDRCDMKNVLSMLENIKLFMNVKNLIIIIAVDMDKIEKAWELQYNNINARMIGRDYTEKMFQLELSVPPKFEDDLKIYVQKMTKSFGRDNTKFLVNALPPNPRKIKLALNFIYFVLSTIPKSSLTSGSINEKNYLVTLITWIAIMNNHNEIAEVAKKSPQYLVHAAFACAQFQQLFDFQISMRKYALNYKMNAFRPFSVNGYRTIDMEYMNPTLLKILEIVADGNPRAFKILRYYGCMFDINIHDHSKPHVGSKFEDKFKPFYSILEQIIKNSPRSQSR